MYEVRLAERRARVASLELRSRRLADARLAMFLLVIAVGVASFVYRVYGPAWIAVPLLGFLALVVIHDRALKAQRRAGRAVRFYERGLARIDDRWTDDGETGEAFVPSDHPYAADLDLFGKASLFQLLNAARTSSGEATLARWLLETADAPEVRSRQRAVEALRGRLELREDLAVLGEDVRAGLDGPRLASWGEQPVELPGWLRPAATALAAGALVTVVGWRLWNWGPLPFLGALALELGFTRLVKDTVEQAIAAVSRAGRDLALLAESLERVERELLEEPRLARLQQALGAGGVRASERIAQLEKRVNLLEARGNQFFAPFAFVLLWTAQCAVSIANWRRLCGPQLGSWISTLGELEALSCLAAYAYEHPEDPFPEVLDSGAVYEGVALGHPLIPASACVRNDLSLSGERRLLLVSGSNMSGKSTFLRTVGINAVLALAGAPVRAQRLTLAPVRLGATLRIQDSLQRGASRFYAEITRLKQILDLTGGDRPLLFLLDEILHGTNSHDRRIGAEALIRALLERGALGLVTTHDLALADLASSLGARAANAHFADHVEDGRLAFDYKKREGVVQQSNAIALMRAVGLPL